MLKLSEHCSQSCVFKISYLLAIKSTFVFCRKDIDLCIFLKIQQDPGCLALSLNSPDLYILLVLAVTNLKQKHEEFYCSLSIRHALLSALSLLSAINRETCSVLMWLISDSDPHRSVLSQQYNNEARCTYY